MKGGPGVDILDRFRHAYILNERGLSPSTARSYVWGCTRMSKMTGKPIQEVTAADWRRYLQESQDPPNSKSLMLAAGKAFHRFWCLETNSSPNGILALKPPKARPVVMPTITRDEARALICSVFDPISTMLVYLGLYQGLRISEMTEIERWEEGWMTLNNKGKIREVPVHPEVERVRETTILSQVVTVGMLAYRAKLLGEHTGISFYPHLLRGRYSRELEEAEVAWEIIQALMGHSGASDVTVGYTGNRTTRGISRKRLREAQGKVDYFDGSPPPPVAFQPRLF